MSSFLVALSRHLAGEPFTLSPLKRSEGMAAILLRCVNPIARKRERGKIRMAGK
jgi:hypothetical protein